MYLYQIKKYLIKGGEKMKINKEKYHLAMAKTCKSRKDLIAAGIPLGTLTHVGNSEMKPVTVGRIAKALGVDVTEIIEQ